MEAPRSNKWEDFCWPDWVPQDLRAQIEEFWSWSMGRGPSDWVQYDNYEPRFGDTVTMTVLVGHEKITGRYVHRWNNIGAIVKSDGSWGVVSI